MKIGDIVLIPFPFTELTNIKVRPAIYITSTKDIYKDVIVCAISSVIPKDVSKNEFAIEKDDTNELRRDSIVKVDQIVTLKRKDIIAQLGNLNKRQLDLLKDKFKSLID